MFIYQFQGFKKMILLLGEENKIDTFIFCYLDINNLSGTDFSNIYWNSNKSLNTAHTLTQ